MWGWGFMEVVLASSAIFITVLCGITIPEDFNIFVAVPTFLTAVVTLAHGIVYLKTGNRIRKIEEYFELTGMNPEILERVKQANMYPVDSVVTEKEAKDQDSQPDIIDKLNALDPQSRRVVESVIEAESKRSAE